MGKLIKRMLIRDGRDTKSLFEITLGTLILVVANNFPIASNVFTETMINGSGLGGASRLMHKRAESSCRHSGGDRRISLVSQVIRELTCCRTGPIYCTNKQMSTNQEDVGSQKVHLWGHLCAVKSGMKCTGRTI